MSTDDNTDLLVIVARRLFIALGIFLTLGILIVYSMPGSTYTLPTVVITSGTVGGFVGLQRRLTNLTKLEIRLMANSWTYTFLSPLVGGVLALLLYVLFLSGLLSGDIFPHFVAGNATLEKPTGIMSLFHQHGESYKEYAKLIFWCFVAGFSERFVADIISRFEGNAGKNLSLPTNIKRNQKDTPKNPQKETD